MLKVEKQTPEQFQRRRSGVFIVNFDQMLTNILQLAVVFLLLSLNK